MTKTRYYFFAFIITILLFLFSCTLNTDDGSTTSYAVIVGINDYLNSQVNDLNWCVNDAEGIKQALIDAGWDENNITLLVDDNGSTNATKNNILNALSGMIQKADADDFILFYYSGHGTQVTDQNGDEADGIDEAIVPVDFDGNSASLILDDELGELFSQSKTQKGVFIFDSCFSGGFINKETTGGDYRVKGISIYPVNLKSTQPISGDLDVYNIPVLTASAQDKVSSESATLQHGVFTYWILEGLSDNNADYNGDGYITVREIFKFAETYTKESTGGAQTPEIQEPQFFTYILITH